MTSSLIISAVNLENNSLGASFLFEGFTWNWFSEGCCVKGKTSCGVLTLLEVENSLGMANLVFFI
jgi:hypothetical protein